MVERRSQRERRGTGVRARGHAEAYQRERERSSQQRGPHAEEVLNSRGPRTAPLSLTGSVHMLTFTLCRRSARDERAEHRDPSQSQHQSIKLGALLVRGLHPAEVLTRTEVLTAEERGPNTAIVSFLTHAALLTSNV